MNHFERSAALILRYVDERSEILETLRTIAAHAGMAYRHANDTGCRASLRNVERAALDAIDRLQGGGA